MRAINNQAKSRCGSGGRYRGFTLLEGLAASVVLAILVIGVFGSLDVAYQQAQIVRVNGAAVMLARQLGDEITSKPFSDPITGATALGPDAGMTGRSMFTHVTNYDGYNDSSLALPLLGGGSIDATGSDPYWRQCSVVAGASPSIDALSPSSDFGIASVVVTGPGGQSVTISKFVARYPVQQ
ncbi:MAG: prepilin-type N-terminal cleavage/methylation domain-containing protein [Planctomycetota bacterium]|nr:prepilin-type N-terminal cleavage/methylation domain-containing protein [Planctomycetota bacterium]